MKNLTATQLEVLHLLCAGHSTKTIAAKLNASPKTIEQHRCGIYYRFKVDSRVAAIRVALRRGLITLDEFMSSTIGENAEHEIPHHEYRKEQLITAC